MEFRENLSKTTSTTTKISMNTFGTKRDPIA